MRFARLGNDHNILPFGGIKTTIPKKCHHNRGPNLGISNLGQNIGPTASPHNIILAYGHGNLRQSINFHRIVLDYHIRQSQIIAFVSSD